MKVAIITLYGMFNYGNRLQNYALQRSIEKLGHHVETIAVDYDKNILKRYIKNIVIKQSGKFTIRPAKERLREKNFKLFNKTYIKTRLFHRANGKIPTFVNNDYDIFIVGSDQVWNPLFWEKSEQSPELYNFLLKFCDKRKISYAASFGVASLPAAWSNQILTEIKKFDAVSVREETGLDILSGFRDAKVVVDPTLLLDVGEWRKMESNLISKKKPYIATYFLGRQPARVHETIDKKAKELQADVIKIMDENDSFAYTKGPDTFLEIIDKADAVFTDSFHASVFSLVYHTPFAVYGREHSNHSDMNDRINTLLSLAGIENGISTAENLVLNNKFIQSDINIERERNRSLQFLNAVLTNS